MSRENIQSGPLFICDLEELLTPTTSEQQASFQVTLDANNWCINHFNYTLAAGTAPPDPIDVLEFQRNQWSSQQQPIMDQMPVFMDNGTEPSLSQSSLYPAADPNEILVPIMKNPSASSSVINAPTTSDRKSRYKSRRDRVKLTGRERQRELERQETQQLQMRNFYQTAIKELEQKCSKLREILRHLVLTSPKYNDQIKGQLNSLGLFGDKHDKIITTIKKINSSTA